MSAELTLLSDIRTNPTHAYRSAAYHCYSPSTRSRIQQQFVRSQPCAARPEVLLRTLCFTTPICSLRFTAAQQTTRHGHLELVCHSLLVHSWARQRSHAPGQTVNFASPRPVATSPRLTAFDHALSRRIKGDEVAAIGNALRCCLWYVPPNLLV